MVSQSSRLESPWVNKYIFINTLASTNTPYWFARDSWLSSPVHVSLQLRPLFSAEVYLSVILHTIWVTYKFWSWFGGDVLVDCDVFDFYQCIWLIYFWFCCALPTKMTSLLVFTNHAIHGDVTHDITRKAGTNLYVGL